MYETYWALIIGLGVNTGIQVLLSYIILSYRTKFTTSQLLISFAFGKWMILKNIVGHARAKFDVWYAASTFSLHSIGGYNTMKDIAMLPARELIGPVFQVLYSYMSQEKASKELQKAKQEAAALIDQANKRAAQIVEASKDDARKEGEKLIEQAKAEIEQERNQARDALRAEIAAIAIAGAEKILETSVDASKHSEMLDKLAAEL